MDAMKQQDATSPCLVDENGDTRSMRTAFAHNDLYRRRSRNSVALPKCMPTSAVYKSNCRFSLSQMIDRVCRILFPVTFAFVNILYWGLLAMNWTPGTTRMSTGFIWVNNDLCRFLRLYENYNQNSSVTSQLACCWWLSCFYDNDLTSLSSHFVLVILNWWWKNLIPSVLVILDQIDNRRAAYS